MAGSTDVTAHQGRGARNKHDSHGGRSFVKQKAPNYAASVEDEHDACMIPVWWRRAVLPSLPWVVCFLSFFLFEDEHDASAGAAL